MDQVPLFNKLQLFLRWLWFKHRNSSPELKHGIGTQGNKVTAHQALFKNTDKGYFKKKNKNTLCSKATLKLVTLRPRDVAKCSLTKQGNGPGHTEHSEAKQLCSMSLPVTWVRTVRLERSARMLRPTSQTQAQLTFGPSGRV